MISKSGRFLIMSMITPTTLEIRVVLTSILVKRIRPRARPITKLKMIEITETSIVTQKPCSKKRRLIQDNASVRFSIYVPPKRPSFPDTACSS